MDVSKLISNRFNKKCPNEILIVFETEKIKVTKSKTHLLRLRLVDEFWDVYNVFKQLKLFPFFRTLKETVKCKNI